jgi:hypothetical protein
VGEEKSCQEKNRQYGIIPSAHSSQSSHKPSAAAIPWAELT